MAAALAALMRGQPRRLHLRPHLPDREPRDVPVLLAGRRRHRPAARRARRHRAAGPDGGQPGGRPHGRLLRGRTLERARGAGRQRRARPPPARTSGPTTRARRSAPPPPSPTPIRTPAAPWSRRCWKRGAGSTPRPTNRDAAAEVLASPAFVNADASDRRAPARPLRRRPGHAGRSRPAAFHGDGEATFPWLSDGMWFMTQHRRWGLLREDLDYLAVAAA
jgi:hypothetical protein